MRTSLRLAAAYFDHWRIEGSRAIAKNFAWLAGDRVIRMGVGFLLGAAVARHLGPQEFGVLTYALAIAELVGVFACLGFEGLLGRDLVRHPEKAQAILGTGFWSSLVAVALLYGSVIVPMARWLSASPEASGALLLTGLLMMRAPLAALNLEFSVQLKAWYGVMAANSAFLVCTAVRLWLIFQGASVVPFAAALLIEPAGTAILLYCFYRRAGYRVSSWRWSLPLAKRLMGEGWPLLLSGFATMVYMRLDQVMLAHLRGDAEVGIYSAALRFSEVWYFLPIALASSLMPSLVRGRELSPEAYRTRLQRYYDVNAALAYALIILLVPLAPWLFTLVFGSSYAGADLVFQIHIWAGLFVFLGVARGQYLTIEGWTRFTFFCTTSGAVVNVALNFMLIPSWGGAGAAIATVVSQAVCTFLSSFAWGPTRQTGWAQARALLLPLRGFGWIRKMLVGLP